MSVPPEPREPPPSPAVRAHHEVPTWLAIGGAWGWRFVALSLALYIVLKVCMELWVAVLPVLLGAIIASLLEPLARLLRRIRVPRAIAGALSVLLLMALVVGAGLGIGFGVADELDRLKSALELGYRKLVQISAEYAGTSQDAVKDYIDGHLSQIQSYAGSIAQQLFERMRGVAQGVTVLLVTFVFAWFFTWDGDKQFANATAMLPTNYRMHARELGQRVWGTVGGYMRGMMIIAAADALLLGLGLWIIGLPLVLPLMLLMFVGAFVPLVGPVLTGVVASLVALGTGDLTTVGLVILVSVAVQQVEGNLLHPFIMGRAVELHPAMVLFAITAGGVLVGVVGVFLAIPIAASLATVLGYAREQAKLARE